MSIKIFDSTVQGQTAAMAVPVPRNITFDGKQFVVRDGPDYIAPDPLTPDEIDREAARAYAKLAALRKMTPAQIQAWVSANVTNLAQAQDAITTLAIAVGILARNI